VRVLIVEDDDALASSLSRGLEEKGFDVDRVAEGRAALDAREADVVLLDLRLPDTTGIDVLVQLRQRSETPVIMLSASDDEIDRVVTLELGADDYVTKPFSLRELVSRMRAVTRRSGRSMADALLEPEPTVVRGETGELTVDSRRRRVLVNGSEVVLTPKEFELLGQLAGEPGAVVTRAALIESVWDRNWFGSTKTLDIHIASLRKKLGDSRWIETHRGVGYRLRA
jgi:DNA-binding response OmpR family regulator